MTVQRIAVCVGVLLALFAVWKLFHPVHTYRFRLTIEVKKDGAVRSGSSVIELRTQRNPFLSKLVEIPEWTTSVRGEAVYVDLGGGDHVIALLARSSNEATAALPSRAILGDKVAFAGPPGVLDTLSTLHRDALRAARGRSYQLDGEQLPPLIRFARLDDPKSVERVAANPKSGSNDEAPMVTGRLEITRDEVTETIRAHLPWLDRGRPDTNLRGGNGAWGYAGVEPYTEPSGITYSNFIAEH